jgi:hypothetical protein
MTLPRIGVVHAPFGAADLQEIGRSAAGRCTPVILFREDVAAANAALVRMAERLFEIAVAPADGLAEHVRGLDGLVTFHDAYLETVDALRTAVGLPGAPPPFNPWDKLEQRKRLAAAGLTRVAARAVDTPDDLTSAVAELGLPCLLKPRRGAGGAGVAFLNEPADLIHQLTTRRRWRDLLLETRLPDGTHPHGGELADFVSVETANLARSHRHLAVFDKTPVHVVPRAGVDGADAVNVTGDLVPSRLPADQAAEVRAYVGRCLEVLGVTWRVTHTEVKLTPAGPDLIELNGRVGGHLNRLLGLVAGPDLVATALTLASGREPVWPADDTVGSAMGMYPPVPVRSDALRTLQDRATRQDLTALVSVDRLTPAREANGWLVVLRLHAPTPAELDRCAARTLDTLAGLAG